MPASNRHIKQLVRDGKRCYICKTNAPYRIDEVGGAICRECDERIQTIRRRVARQGGYSLRNREQPE